ncbi:uncharacterized protein HaLaN_16041 [Haematococcus lacustris]|uniref:Cytochrome P450 n=1 Tax=Haematococcus lacustris TaxID=44745 RepID=A0A699ZI26_HAELA|nr:uncharacterized protein HaLaN_16041 [Haematococcus lacustris]
MEVGGPSCWPLPRSVELDDLPRLKYLNACIKEAMRMLPVVSVMGRTSGDAPLQLGPYTLPPRTTVGIPLYAIQNADANWERAAEFLPERWMKMGGREGVRQRESTLLTLQVRGSQGLRMALTPRWLP